MSLPFTIPPYEGNEPLSGELYVVSTPIGNLADISLRALAILSRVDFIAAEDTRSASVLLRHYGISTPCTSMFSRNERRRVPEFLEQLKAGKSIAVVSDAGTPGVSDPAAVLIAEAVSQGIVVKAVPGASAALCALAVSGFRMDRFHFEGFLPIKKRRKTRIAELAQEERTIILYESPHRLIKTLGELRDAFGERRVAVCRELTKKFEEIFRGLLSDALARFTARPPRGEFVLILEGNIHNQVVDNESLAGDDID